MSDRIYVPFSLTPERERERERVGEGREREVELPVNTEQVGLSVLAPEVL
jgi:hypothetical protein